MEEFKASRSGNFCRQGVPTFLFSEGLYLTGVFHLKKEE